MEQESKKTLSQLEKIVGDEIHDPRQKFMRVKDVCEIYHMSRPKIIDEALNAGALYRLPRKEGSNKGTILINVVIFDEYLENFRIPGGMMRL